MFCPVSLFRQSKLGVLKHNFIERKLTMDNMLSKALREFMTGPLNQLIVNMGGKNGDMVEAELSKFNRGEPCWSESPHGILLRDDTVAKTMDAVAKLATRGYLDTSFDNRAVHPLSIRPLSKAQAFAKYRKSGGKTTVWDEIEKHMRYQKPKAQLLLVMNIQFGCGIGGEDALGEMCEFGVQPFFGEWLIQFGCARPNYQKKSPLVALGTKFDAGGRACTPYLSSYDGDVRGMHASPWHGYGNLIARCRFPVVIKGIEL